MKRYQGTRLDGAVTVTVDGEPLSPRLDLGNHSPSGFEWGYGGSGPAQLALALLADALGNGATASRWQQDFKRSVVAALAYDHWTLTDEQIRQSVQSLASE